MAIWCSTCRLRFLLSLVCKIRSGTTELSKPVGITVEVYEGKVEGRYSIDGKAELSGFTFVVCRNTMAEKTISFWFFTPMLLIH